jgi:hypothetical protein
VRTLNCGVTSTMTTTAVTTTTATPPQSNFGLEYKPLNDAMCWRAVEIVNVARSGVFVGSYKFGNESGCTCKCAPEATVSVYAWVDDTPVTPVIEWDGMPWPLCTAVYPEHTVSVVAIVSQCFTLDDANAVGLNWNVILPPNEPTVESLSSIRVHGAGTGINLEPIAHPEFTAIRRTRAPSASASQSTKSTPRLGRKSAPSLRNGNVTTSSAKEVHASDNDETDEDDEENIGQVSDDETDSDDEKDPSDGDDTSDADSDVSDAEHTGVQGDGDDDDDNDNITAAQSQKTTKAVAKKKTPVATKASASKQIKSKSKKPLAGPKKQRQTKKQQSEKK